MAIAAVSIYPLGQGESVSRYVAEAEKVFAAKPNLKRELGPMFTTLEGDLDEIMAAVREAQEVMFAAGALRVATSIKIDDRRDKAVTMEGKIKAVEDKLKKTQEPEQKDNLTAGF